MFYYSKTVICPPQGPKAAPGGPQEALGGPRRPQETPGCPRKPQEAPGREMLQNELQRLKNGRPGHFVGGTTGRGSPGRPGQLGTLPGSGSPGRTMAENEPQRLKNCRSGDFVGGSTGRGGYEPSTTAWEPWILAGSLGATLRASLGQSQTSLRLILRRGTINRELATVLCLAI